MFTKFEILDFYETISIGLIRLDAVITGIFNSFRQATLSGSNAGIEILNEHLVSVINEPPRIIEMSFKPGHDGGSMPWDCAKRYRVLLLIASYQLLNQLT